MCIVDNLPDGFQFRLNFTLHGAILRDPNKRRGNFSLGANSGYVIRRNPKNCLCNTDSLRHAIKSARVRARSEILSGTERASESFAR